MPFRTALSGLNASSAELRVLGNNVANASTTGFKKSRAQFSDIFASSNLGTASNAIGSGVRVSSVAQQFTQGNVGFTDNNLDLAISGQGFFRLNDNGVSVYTRAGTFGVDREGYIVNSQDQRLTGFLADTAGTITGALGDLRLDQSDISPQATATVDAGINLDASSSTPAAPISTSVLTNTGTFDNAQAVTGGAVSDTVNDTSTAAATIYDSYGGSHTAQTYFKKTTEGGAGGTDVWESVTYVDGIAATPVTTLQFDNDSGILTGINGTPGQSTQTHPTINIATGPTAGATIDLTDNFATVTLAGANAAAMTANGSAQGTFDVTDASTYNSSTSLTVYDSLGTAHLATTYYRKTGIPNQWQTWMYIDGNQVDGGTTGDTLTFTPAGALTQINGAATPPSTLSTPAFDPGGGASLMTLTMDYADLSQYGSPFSVNSLTQDGFATGRLSGIDIDDSGIVLARFTNGQSRTLAQIALGNFSNPQGLRQLGDTSWAESFESGAALVGPPGTASLGLITSGALEGSNVDLTEQLVGMITAQRNFQANAQVISTADTITQAIINIR